jgi:hypothetical protein
MTLNELIAKLEAVRKEHGGELRVTVDGYEADYDDLTHVEVLRVKAKPYQHASSCLGYLELADDGELAVNLPGTGR